MERSTEQVFKELSEVVGVEVGTLPGNEGQAPQAIFNVGAIISKILALAIYVGSPVHGNFPLLLNQVHADIEWWKAHFATAKTVQPADDPAKCNAEAVVVAPAEQPQEKPAA